MSLGDNFCNSVRNIVTLKQDELDRQQNGRRSQILNECANKGWQVPTGNVHAAFADMQVDAINQRQDIVWHAIEKTLAAFDPKFDPNLSADLYALIESFFPTSLCNPHDYLRSYRQSMGPVDEANTLRFSLEHARRVSLQVLKSKIDLYVAKRSTVG